MPRPTPKHSKPPALDGLMLAARQLVDGLYAGRHASPTRGSGAEFHDYRPYTAGDDLRAIDWKLYGRTDRYYLKRFRKETDLNLHLAVDGSASMAFAALDPKRSPSHRPSKLDTAKRLAAALALLAVRQGDRAGLSVFDAELRCHHPASGSLRQLQTMTADLEQTRPAQGPADLGASLQQLGSALRRRGVVAVISDLLDEPEGLLRSIDRLRHAGSEVIVFQTLTPDEIDLGGASAQAYRMTDPERDASASVQARPPQVARRYAQLIEQHLQHLRRALAARDIDYTLVRTDRPLEATLRRYLLMRSRRAR
ncbi:MAG: DUF58 domain-containing protein [Planctomycetota bacterium]